MFATLTLTAVSLLAGIAMLWAFGRFSNQEKIAFARHKLRAYLYELTLFSSDPVLMWRAQRRLLGWNLRYLGLMLRPALIIAAPTVLLLSQLDAIYGRRPLAIGEPALVTARFASSVDLRAVSPTLDLPPGAFEAGTPVRLPAEHRVLWRVTPLRKFRGSVRVRLAGRTLTQHIAAGGISFYLPYSLATERIEIAYPSSSRWLVWFCLVSFAGAFLLRKRLRVVF